MDRLDKGRLYCSRKPAHTSSESPQWINYGNIVVGLTVVCLPASYCIRFFDDAVSEEGAEHLFKLVPIDEDLSGAFFELK